MELNWLESLLYGMISGLTEFLPISSLAHQTVFRTLFGWEYSAILQFFVRLGVCAAAIIPNVPHIKRLFKEQRIQATPKKRRRRHPDFGALMEIRVLRTATAVMLLSFLAYGFVADLHERLWLLVLLICVNGAMLYLPQYLPGANKQAQSLSGLDATLIGIFAGFGILPGISRIASTLYVALVRGADRKYAVNLAFLLAIPGLIGLLIFEGIALVTSGIAISGFMILKCVTAAVAAFFGGCWAMSLVRFMAVKVGFSGFAYYCFGLALFTLILYLI